MMKLFQYREKINTDCPHVSKPILNIYALKVDSPNKNSLKNNLKCANMNTCDYLKKFKGNIYFIEISDLIWELEDLTNKYFSKKNALREIKKGIQLKLAQSYILFEKLVNSYKINLNNIKKKIVLLAVCTEDHSDIIILSYIENTLSDVFVPSETYQDIRLIPYRDIENVFSKS